MTAVTGPGASPWQLAHLQDVTERKAAELAVRESESNLSAVAEVVSALRAGQDPRTTIVRALHELAGTSSVCLLETDERGMVVTAAAGIPLQGARLGRGASSGAGHVWRTGRPLFLADPHRDPRVSPELLELSGARSVLWHPVLIQARVRAVLAVTWDVRVEAPTPRAAQAIALLSNETAVALEHDALLERLGREAVTDPLTGLSNRRAWDVALQRLLEQSKAHGHAVTVALADLDRFKTFNDTYGHLAGDELLQQFGTAAREQLRDGDVLARWGGEEFALALPDCAAPVAEQVLERLRGVDPGTQTISIGHAVWDGVETAAELLARADAALFAAKAGGRDRVCPAPAA